MAPVSDFDIMSTAMPPRYEDWEFTTLLHEYTHIIQLDMNDGFQKKLREIFGRVPFITQHNDKMTYAWLEGIAVYYESILANSSRSMNPIYRMYMRAEVLGDRLPELDQFIGYYILDRYCPSAYTYPYGSIFVQYIADTYGPEAVRDINLEHAKQPFPGIWWAFRKVIGKDIKTVWEECRQWIAENERNLIAEVRSKGVVEGERLTKNGDVTLGAVPLGTGGRPGFVYLNYDQSGISTVKFMESDGTEKTLARTFNNLAARPALSADGSKVVYPDFVSDTSGNERAELYEYDFVTGKTTRITDGARAIDPAFSPDGNEIAYVQIKPYKHTLVIMDRRDGSTRELNIDPDIVQMGSPVFSPDGKEIALGVVRVGGWQDIVIVDKESGSVYWVTSDRTADFTPSWSPDGRYLYYSSDLDGVYNIYAYDLADKEHYRITRVLTGAFQPYPTKDGKTFLYTGYTINGFDIFSMAVEDGLWEKIDRDLEVYEGRQDSESSFDAANVKGMVFEPAPYSAWDSLAPKYWLPVATNFLGNWIVGVTTSGMDALRNTSYSAGVIYDTFGESVLLEVGAQHAYSGLGPIIYGSYAVDLTNNNHFFGVELEKRFDRIESGTIRKLFGTTGSDVYVGVSLGRVYIYDFYDLYELDDDDYDDDYDDYFDEFNGGHYEWIGEVYAGADFYYYTGEGPNIRWGNMSICGFQDVKGEYRGVYGSVSTNFDYKGLPNIYTSVSFGYGQNYLYDLGGMDMFGVRGTPIMWKSGDLIGCASIDVEVYEYKIERGLSAYPIYFDKVGVRLFTDAGTIRDEGEFYSVMGVGGEIGLSMYPIYGMVGEWSINVGYAVPITVDGASEGSFYIDLSIPLF